MRHTGGIRVVAAVGLAWLAGVAGAAPDSGLGDEAPEAAQQRYAIARHLYRDGKYAEAAAEFGVALALHPTSSRLAYNLARSHERAGQLADAVSAYERYLALAPDAPDRAVVETTVATLRGRLHHTLPEVVISSEPPGATVRVDDRTPLEGTTPLTVRLTPGEHTLRLELAGHAPGATKVSVVAGRANAAQVRLQPEQPPPDVVAEPVAPRTVEDVAPPASPRWRSVTGWTAVGLGVVAAAVGTGFLADAAGRADDSERLEPRDWRSYDAGREDFEAARAAGWSAIGVGGALLAAGAALLLWPDPEGVGAAVAPGGVTAVGQW